MISASIITKNEEANIQRCLNSLKWVDEIVVIDSGSQDQTVAICENFGCKVIETNWMGFGATKQLGVDSSKNDWVLSIDADEEVSDELAKEIQFLISENTCIKNAFSIKRKSFYLGRLINYSGWQDDYPIRLFNRKHAKFNSKSVHEKVEVDDSDVKRINKIIFHYPFPSIEKHIKKINLYSTLAASELFNNKSKHIFLYPFAAGLFKFLKIYIIKKGFLDGKEGLILSLLSSHYVFLKYMKLWVLWKKI